MGVFLVLRCAGLFFFLWAQSIGAVHDHTNSNALGDTSVEKVEICCPITKASSKELCATLLAQ